MRYNVMVTGKVSNDEDVKTYVYSENVGKIFAERMLKSLATARDSGSEQILDCWIEKH